MGYIMCNNWIGQKLFNKKVNKYDRKKIDSSLHLKSKRPDSIIIYRKANVGLSFHLEPDRIVLFSNFRFKYDDKSLHSSIILSKGRFHTINAKLVYNIIDILYPL